MDIIDTFFLVATTGTVVFWVVCAVDDIRRY